MPQPSTRGVEIGASPIRSLMPYARQAKAAGKKVFHLNIGQPDIPTPPEALDAIRKLTDPIVPYGSSKGKPSLRKKVAKYYDKFDAGISEEDVFVTTGASEAIYFALVSCCDVGDEIILPEPFYANYLGFFHGNSVRVKPLTTSFDQNFALPEPAAFERLITPRTKAIFLCNPGNPTGQLYGYEELKELVGLVKKYGLFLIVDEVYREFCYDQLFHSVLAFEGMEEHVIVIDSISKVFSACGARVGYLITKNPKLQEVVEKFAQLRLCPPYYGQHLAEAAYDHAEQYIASAKEAYLLRREVLFNSLSQMEGVHCYKPQAAFYNICQLPVDDSTAFCQWLLSDFDYKGQTLMMAPASGFYAHPALGKDQVRIAYILNEKDLAEAMRCLNVALQQYPGRKVPVAATASTKKQ